MARALAGTADAHMASHVVNYDVENAAKLAASSPALRQELAGAVDQLERTSQSALKLPAAPLPLISLPYHQEHIYKATEAGGKPSSVTVLSDAEIFTTSAAVRPIPAVEVPKVVIEYPVPGARETHEMAVVGHNMLLVTQQSNSTLVKILLSPTTGRPISCARFLMGDFWAGLHGLCPSQVYENQVWASLQYKSLLIRIEPGLTMDSNPIVRQVITLPPSVNGPHCVCECGPDLWTSCKDSSHIVRINHTSPASDFSVYPCSARPIFMARHPTSLDMYSSLDRSSKIWRLVVATGRVLEMDIASAYGTTPVGLVPGTDGNVWFTMLGGSAGGSGQFARILASGEFQWFSLTTPIAADAGLIHLAFDWSEYFNKLNVQQLSGQLNINTATSDDEDEACQPDNNQLHRIWLLSSTLVADKGRSVDALFSVLVDVELGRITTQQSVVLPTQRCWTHRVLPHRTGVFVSELAVSCLAHITGEAAFHVENVPGETTDFYASFGLGQTIPSYIFQINELPEAQRVATRMAPCPLLFSATAICKRNDIGDPEAEAAKKPAARASKRPRTSMTT